jgi:hypothetical protein
MKSITKKMGLSKLVVNLMCIYFVFIFIEYQIEFDPIYVQNSGQHNL